MVDNSALNAVGAAAGSASGFDYIAPIESVVDNLDYGRRKDNHSKDLRFLGPALFEPQLLEIDDRCRSILEYWNLSKVEQSRCRSCNR